VVPAVGFQGLVEGLGLGAGQHAFGGLQLFDAGQVLLVERGVLDDHGVVAGQADAQFGEVGAAEDDHVRLDQVELPVDALLVAEVDGQRQVVAAFADAVLDEVRRGEGVDGPDHYVQTVAVGAQAFHQGFGAGGEGGDDRDLLVALLAEVAREVVLIIEDLHRFSSSMGSAKCRHCRTPVGRFHAWCVKACGRAGGWVFCRSELARERSLPVALVQGLRAPSP